MIGDDVQDLLDSLAVAVGRGMAVDDSEGQVVAHSVHHGEVDRVRAQAILSRSVPSEVRAWQEAHGVATIRVPVRVPANPALGMAARLCVPLIHQERRVGLLWIIEGEGPLSPEEEARAVRDAAAIAALLDDGGGSGTLRRLLVGGITVERAAGVLGDRPLRLLALRGDREDLGRAVGEELSRMRRPTAFAVLDRHAVLLLNGGEDAAALGERLIARTGGGAGVSAVHAGLGSVGEAYREAVAAARAAVAEPALGPVARWPELGVYRLLAEPSATPLGPLREHPALTVTLEVYLDSGGDAQETARLLHLHRTSLYYRLARIEQATGRSLKDGADRLELHLALKLARWNAV
ncbi:PucR family transcriptional regulator [Streptosporangium carneum]|uniref:Transcriptional regulator n=1 Tax=Streptosporangium carneum TaxID=47481 RepID=A0A9W6MD24_9ACTN|nr:helix-turn-helix domain-containing protein [Streptosporangium carneum]GLK09716.1 transcriptional regulator [Streptosporangium carneum]